MRWVIALASIVTVFAIAVGGRLIAHELSWWYSRQSDLYWIREGVAYVAAGAIIASLLPSSKLSRFVRTGVLLPLVQAGLVGVAWYVWTTALPHLAESSDGRAFAAGFPLIEATLVTIPVLLVLAIVAARRRSGEWVHGFATFALAELLLVGLWMPIACEITAASSGADEWWDPSAPLLPHPLQTTILIVALPTLVAAIYTTLSLRRPGWAQTHRSRIVKLLGLVLAVSVLTRMAANPRAMVLYSNFVPLLLVAMLAAVTALVVLAIVTLVRGYQARRRFAARERIVGVIEADSRDPVIGIQIASWLRGPRIVQRPFAIATSQGTIPVSGAELVAPLPASTTLLAATETLGVIHPGETVIVAGHVADGGDPFRSSAAPLSGALYVAPADVERAGFASATLAMWRPCVAYLLIVTTVALPGLAALLG
ncbi:MAG TPA: hypothetical protein VLB44_11855 [Kofleriaceae bacterium]|nr:hypothetical protein [Kofleriaceae bacterium]